jgi:ribosomal-protein-alanine N-acetyltransferase
MNTEPVIRFAALADARAIAEMSRDTIEQGLPWTWRPGRVLHAIRDPRTNVVVVGGPGAVEAFAIMSYLDDDAHLLLLAVAPARRRRGIASAMLVWLERVARAAGSQRIRVEARHGNLAARNLYAEHGYHEHAFTRGMYSGRADGVFLEKWLREG